LHSYVYLISYIWLATTETKWDSKKKKYDDLATPSAIRTAEHRRGTYYVLSNTGKIMGMEEREDTSESESVLYAVERLSSVLPTNGIVLDARVVVVVVT
jgi:hypothetical protein